MKIFLYFFSCFFALSDAIHLIFREYSENFDEIREFIGVRCFSRFLFIY